MMGLTLDGYVSWELKHPQATFEMLGFIPMFLIGADPRPAREQFDDRYGMGGDWHPLTHMGWRVTDRGLEYPGDPPMALIAEAKLRDEVIRLYNCAWVTITQPDGSVLIQRMD